MPETPNAGAVPPPVLGGRREAREQALLLLYESEVRGLDADRMVGEVTLDPEPYTVEVLRGVEAARDDLDRRLQERSPDWPLRRMPAMDRAALRLGLWELMERPDIPTAVVLNEAAELAGRYGTDDSSRFVNGVLAALARLHRGDAESASAAAVTPPSESGEAEAGDEPVDELADVEGRGDG